MSLLHPTPGEMHDRFIIIQMKISAFTERNIDKSSLEKERMEIASCLWSKRKIDFDSITELSNELMNVNSELWLMEDSIRSTREDTIEHVALVAKRIAHYNDERNRLIREIDKAYGCENPVEEKIYSCTPQK